MGDFAGSWNVSVVARQPEAEEGAIAESEARERPTGVALEAAIEEALEAKFGLKFNATVSATDR